MRCSSPHRTVVGGLSWICVLVFGLFAPARAEDHPFAVVALASFDRVVARAASLGDVVGLPDAGETLLVSYLGGDDELKKLFNSPGFDTTRPVGIMSYPKWFSGEVEVAGNGETGDGVSKPPETPSFGDLFDDPLGFLAGGIMENATIAFCFPAKDREQLLATIAEVMEQKFTPVAGRPGWFEAEGEEDARIVFVGRYLLLVNDDGKVKQWDRNYPDFEKLAKSSLGQNGFAYSLYRRGLPKLVREDMAEAFKLAHAATLQRQDDEPEAAFKVRTMFGPLMTESLDLLLSQIEEFRITGHVDSNTHQTLVDVELIGPKDGKLAKLANGLTTKSSPFGNLSTDDALFAANVSLPLSPKLWKPVAESLRLIGEEYQEENTWLREFARVLAKTVEAGQFELHVSYTNGGEGLLALRVAGNPTFPEQVQAGLETLAKLPVDADQAGAVKIAVDTVEGWPIHQLPTSVLAYFGLIEGLIPARVIKRSSRVEVDGEGNIRGVTELQRHPLSEEPSSCWLAATPNGLWLAFGSPGNSDCPAWFKSAIEASLAKPTAATTPNRSNAPVRVMLRGLGASPAAKDSADDKPDDDNKVTQAAARDVPAAKPKNGAREQKPLTAEQLAQRAAAEEQRQRRQQQERERGDLLRDGSNTIRVELRPTANGLRVRTTFDDAYFHWFATMLKQSIEEMALQVEPHNVEPPEPPPPPPPLK